MSKSTNGLRKAGLASLAVTLTLGAGFAGAGAAFADADFEFTRIAGENRYHTAALVADAYETATTDEVILVNGEAGYYADALTANYLSGVRKAPILLTRDEFMPEATQTALADLDPAKVTIVGGEGVVPADQADWLESEGYTVERFAGANRFGTNVEVIEAGGATTKDTGIVATGFDFADALGAGPAVYQGRPLGLAKSDDIDDEIVDALDASGVTKIVVLGGEAVVGDEVVDELEDAGFTVTRVDGADRSETSTEFADYAIANFGFTNKAADVASGYTLGSGADALAGGPLTGERNRPMLITKNLDNPGDLVNWLEAHAATLEEGVIYGGYGAVTASAEDRMEAAARSVSSNQDYTVTPQDEATLTVATPDDATDDRRYTVNGLADGTYTIVLANAENVSTDANGVVSFEEDGSSNEADFGTVAARITVINGTATGGVVTDTASPVNGQITFTVDGADFESVVPVLFADADEQGDLDLDANNQPTENFGIGGVTNYLPGEAASGPIASTLIEQVNKDEDFFIAGDLYEYDSNDRYYIDDAATPGGALGDADPTEEVTQAEFEAQLSVGDNIDGVTYLQNDALSSTFLLGDAAPGQPAVTATGGQGFIELEIDPANPDLSDFDADDQLVVERAPVTALGGDGVLGGGDDTVGTYAEVATLTKADDEDTTTAEVLEYTDSVDAGNYSYRVTAVVDGEESPASAADSAASTADTTDPTVTTVTPNDINNGVGSTNQIIVTFSEPVSEVDVAKWAVYPTLQPGLEIAVTGASARNESGSVWTFTLGQAIEDAPTDIEYTVDADAEAFTDAAGNDNVAETDTFDY